MTLLYVALGGGLGAVFRAFLTALTQKFVQTWLPVATLTVNLIGAFCIGLLSHLPHLSTDMKLFFITGLLGGFTTFSTLTLELFNMVNQHHWGRFFIYTALQYLGCMALCYIGFVI